MAVICFYRAAVTSINVLNVQIICLVMVSFVNTPLSAFLFVLFVILFDSLLSLLPSVKSKHVTSTVFVLCRCHPYVALCLCPSFLFCCYFQPPFLHRATFQVTLFICLLSSHSSMILMMTMIKREIYYQRMTTRRGRTTDCCHSIQSHGGNL